MFTTAGWSEAEPTDEQGLLPFAYKGTNALVLWVQREGSTPEAMLAETYQTLSAVQPNLTFRPVSEGDVTVSGTQGKVGGFVAVDASDVPVGAGLIGAWVCPVSGKAIALTVTGSDATTLQVRFDRLLENAECSD